MPWQAAAKQSSIMAKPVTRLYGYGFHTGWKATTRTHTRRKTREKPAGYPYPCPSLRSYGYRYGAKFQHLHGWLGNHACGTIFMILKYCVHTLWLDQNIAYDHDTLQYTSYGSWTKSLTALSVLPGSGNNLLHWNQHKILLLIVYINMQKIKDEKIWKNMLGALLCETSKS